MAQYSPEFLSSLRHRYEKTDEPMRALALDFKIGISTLSAIVEREGWAKRSRRQRNRVPTTPLIEEAQALLASLPPRGATTISEETTPSPTLPLSGGGSASANAQAALTPAERLEALVEKEIAAEEAVRADLGALPRLRSEADGCVRRLAGLTQLVHTLQRIRAEAPATKGPTDDDDDMPRDLDAFRDELARRIDAFVASRPDEADAACTDAADADANP